MKNSKREEEGVKGSDGLLAVVVASKGLGCAAEAGWLLAMGAEEELQSNAVNPSEEEGSEYSWPVLRFDVPPHRTYHFHKQFITPSNPNNFLKGVKW